jgi:hypothetical protein
LSKIHKFKDIHKGEDCYFFGNGVSLKWFDLKQFSNKVSIGSSVLPFHNSFDDINLKYLMLTEPFWFYPSIYTKFFSSSVSQPHLSKAYRKVVKDNPDVEFFFNLSNFPVIRSHNVNYLFREIKDDRLPNNFISNQIDCFTGSLRIAVLMAIYMGFDHIYLLGCDYTHTPPRAKHWYEKGKGVNVSHLNYEKEFFETAKEFINITTITLEGESEFINSITYEDFTGLKPFYRENNEIVNHKYLKVLDTWPGYTIY